MLEPAAKSIGKEVLNTGASIASDVIRGSSFKESAKTRLKEAGEISSTKFYREEEVINENVKENHPENE